MSCVRWEKFAYFERSCACFLIWKHNALLCLLEISRRSKDGTLSKSLSMYNSRWNYFCPFSQENNRTRWSELKPQRWTCSGFSCFPCWLPGTRRWLWFLGTSWKQVSKVERPMSYAPRRWFVVQMQMLRVFCCCTQNSKTGGPRVGHKWPRLSFSPEVNFWFRDRPWPKSSIPACRQKEEMRNLTD